jgi:hypothetical protein
MRQGVRETEVSSQRALQLCLYASVALALAGCPALADDPYRVLDVADASGFVPDAGVPLSGAAGMLPTGGSGGGVTGGGGGTGGGTGTDSCGDGTVQGNEQCDPGTGTSVACTATCQVDCSLFDAAAQPYTLASGAIHCYLLVGTSQAWVEAENSCVGLGGHLVSILSDGEFNFVADSLSISGDVWIGATDYRDSSDTETGPYQWVTGETWGYLPPGGFTPDSCYSAPCDHCLYIGTNFGDELRDRECGTAQPYVCEWSAPGW